MRYLGFILFYLYFSLLSSLYAQLPTSTINIVNRSTPCKLYFNDKFITVLNADEALEYKLFSQGAVDIIAEYSNLRAITRVNVSSGSSHYIITYIASNSPFGGAGLYSGAVKNVDLKKWSKEAEKFSNKISLEESKHKRIIEPDTPESESHQGTCFAISKEGYLVTNYHVIEDNKEITICGIDGDYTTKYGATVVASDPSNDLALVKINNKNVQFTAPPYAIRSSGVAQAEKIYALGYPAANAMGQEVKITEGIISVKSGVGNDISKFQISAAVNPGNSGGPLIDEQGNLIGVIFAKSTLAESAGYAIKASYLETFLKNVDGFEFPNFTNTIQSKTLPEKVADLKNYIFIIEAK